MIDVNTCQFSRAPGQSTASCRNTDLQPNKTQIMRSSADSIISIRHEPVFIVTG